MTESNVVQFPGVPAPEEPAPEPMPTDWLDQFQEDGLPNFLYLAGRLEYAEGEEETRLRMSDIKAAVSTWPI